MKIAVMQWIFILHLLQRQKAKYWRVVRRSGRIDIVAVQQSIAKTVQQLVSTKLEHVLPRAPHWISERSDFFGRQSITWQVDNSSHFLPLFLSPLSGPTSSLSTQRQSPGSLPFQKDLPTTPAARNFAFEIDQKEGAAGHDGICPKELKVIANNIAWHFATLFHESLETGEIPSDFKVGNTKLIPIF